MPKDVSDLLYEIADGLNQIRPLREKLFSSFRITRNSLVVDLCKGYEIFFPKGVMLPGSGYFVEKAEGSYIVYGYRKNDWMKLMSGSNAIPNNTPMPEPAKKWTISATDLDPYIESSIPFKDLLPTRY